MILLLKVRRWDRVRGQSSFVLQHFVRLQRQEALVRRVRVWAGQLA